MRSSVALMFVVYGLSTTGCSLLFTKGPQPEVKPPPPCTTSNVAPGLDTTAAILTTAVMVTALTATGSCSPTGWDFWCTNSSDAAGIWATVGVSAALAALFTTSAVIGFNKTAACRTSLGLEPQPVAPTPLAQSSFLLVPQQGCPTLGDAPRICSAVVLHGVAH
jgi:hypothetical protein